MAHNLKTRDSSVANSIRMAKKLWPSLISKTLVWQLDDLLRRYRFSVGSGDVQLLNGKWYVTHSGLLGLAARRRCYSIRTRAVRELCDTSLDRWVFKATVLKSRCCKGFVGYGDADPSNISLQVKGATMRIAETRALSRALRRAYGIGVASVEELGKVVEPHHSDGESRKLPPQPANGNYSGPKVRDRLCELIRRHRLDPTLVKSYATDFCDTKTLRDATREQVENFVTHLADQAEKDRDALICQLNSYLGRKEGTA
jgi:hypothetical protein